MLEDVGDKILECIHHTGTNLRNLPRHSCQDVVVCFAILDLFHQGNGLIGDDCSGCERPSGDHVTIKIVAVSTRRIQYESLRKRIGPRYRIGVLVLKRLFIVNAFLI